MISWCVHVSMTSSHNTADAQDLQSYYNYVQLEIGKWNATLHPPKTPE